MTIPIVATQGGENVAALAATVPSKASSTESVPPPPSSHPEGVDEFDLMDLRTNSSFETDSYPIIRGEPAPHNAPDAEQIPPLGKALPGRRWPFGNIVTAIIVAAVLTAVAAVIYFVMGQ